MSRILVIEDNETMREGIEEILTMMDYEVTAVSNGTDGLKAFKSREFDFTITDLKMDEMDGIAVLNAIKEEQPGALVMLITAFGTVETAVDAMKMGAFDFIQKPFGPEVLRVKVKKALEVRRERMISARLKRENEILRDMVEAPYAFEEIVGESNKMKAVFTTINKIAPSDSSVLICGDSGTGKELVARAIHRRSRRADRTFIKVNCGALSENLLESELFGHEKGAFTGAIKKKIGRFELAAEGTIFLDEIGDITPSMQLKLLRVLQEREFERVGGEETLQVDVRVIAATNKNLTEEVKKGTFREDLYYRLYIIPIEIPTLRERTEDIPLLVNHFMEKLRQRTGHKIREISDEAVSKLSSYRWPGNVRELENVMEQMLVLADGNSLTTEDLPLFLKDRAGDEKRLLIPEGRISLPEILDDLERQLILKAFERSKGVKTETARQLGIKTSALYYKLEKYGIS